MEENFVVPKVCPSCHCEKTVKDGSVKGMPRRLCRNCGRRYTGRKRKVASPETKRMAVHMYLEGNGFSAIGRLLGYSKTTILYWVRDAGNRLSTAGMTMMFRPRFRSWNLMKCGILSKKKPEIMDLDCF